MNEILSLTKFCLFYIDLIHSTTNLLFTGICWHMEHISDQHKDPLNQKVILFLSLFPVLVDRTVRVGKINITKLW